MIQQLTKRFGDFPLLFIFPFQIRQGCLESGMAAEGGGTEREKGYYHFACSLTELQQLGRKRVSVEERVVVLFHVNGQIYALDHFCYRKSIWLPVN